MAVIMSKGSSTPSVTREIFEVSVDTPAESIQKADAAGFFLQFDTDVGKFRFMDAEELAPLSSLNKGIYHSMLGVARQAEAHAKNPGSGIEVLAKSPLVQFDASSARGRLNATYRDPKLGLDNRPEEGGIVSSDNKRLVWKRPDELHTALASGFRLVSSERVNHRWDTGSGTVTAKRSSDNQDDLILMEVDRDVQDARVRESARRSREKTRPEAKREAFESEVEKIQRGLKSTLFDPPPLPPAAAPGPGDRSRGE